MALDIAASNGHEVLIDRLIELGAKDFDSAFVSAAKNGHIVIVKKFLNLKVTHIQDAILAAIDSDHTEIADLLIQYVIDQEIKIVSLHHIFNDAVIKNNLVIVKKILDIGITNFQYGIALAKQRKNNDMIELIHQYM